MDYLTTFVLAWTIMSLPFLVNAARIPRYWRCRADLWKHVGKVLLAWLIGPVVLLLMGVLPGTEDEIDSS